MVEGALMYDAIMDQPYVGEQRVPIQELIKAAQHIDTIVIPHYA